MKSSLEQAIDAFSTWNSFGKRRGRASNALKKMALDLLPHYSDIELAHTLNISLEMLRKWKDTGHDVDSHEDKHFIPYPLTKTTDQKQNCDKTTAKMTLNLPGGMKLTIPEQSSTKTAQLIFALAKEFSSCSI